MAYLGDNHSAQIHQIGSYEELWEKIATLSRLFPYFYYSVVFEVFKCLN